MRAILSNKIYLVGSTAILGGIKKTLTYEIPPKYTPPGQRPMNLIIRSYKQLAPDMIAIPSGRVDLIPAGWEVVDKRVVVPEETFPDFLLADRLYDEQLELADEMLKGPGCGVLNAKPGWGKTFWSLYLASKLKQKTLVLVHTNNLLEQWAGEIKKTLGIEPTVVKGGRILNKGNVITVALIQSAEKFIEEIGKTFGLVIMDEVHHLPADTFMKVMNGLHAKHKIGMSGTLRRTDKKERLIFDYFSPKVLVAKDKNTLTPTVYLLKSKLDFDKFHGTYAAKITSLCESPEFIEEQLGIINEMLDVGHKVLYVSDRVKTVALLNQLIPGSTLLTGKTTDRETVFDNARAGKSKVILSTTRLFSEGLSENYLSCLILGSFISSDVTLEQIAARITRKYEGKLSPIIIDVTPRGYTMRKQLSGRIEFYESQEWEIVDVN